MNGTHGRALDNLLEKLDDQQRHITEWRPEHGHLRVASVAGSGKTTSLVALSAVLVTAGVVPAHKLILTTFSRKAGDELKSRLKQVLPPEAFNQIRVGTFHSLALQVMRGLDDARWSMQRCLDIGGRAQGVPSANELWRAIVQYGKVPGLNEESLHLDEPASYYSRQIELWRSDGFEHYEPGLLPPTFPNRERRHFINVWDMYNRAKVALKAWDFGDVLAEWRNKLKDGTLTTPGTVVLVDEAQDNNRLQLEIVRLLTADEGRIGLFGDLRQCIYQFRGSYPDLFATADTVLGAETRQISTNYRSAPHIVGLSNLVCAGKSWNLGDPARPHRFDALDPTCVAILSPSATADEEAELVAERIADDLAAGHKAGEYIVLCRTNAAGALFEAALTERRVPLVVLGGSSVFRTREADAVMAYAVLSQYDAVASLDKVLNRPKRFLPHSFVGAVHKVLDEQGPSAHNIVAAIRTAAMTVGLKPGPRRGATQLADDIESLRALEWESVPAAIEELLARVPDREVEGIDEDRMGLVRSVCTIARKFPTVLEFVTFAQKCFDGTSSLDEGTKTDGCVTISTCHKVKGLSWKHVYLSAPRAMFPHMKASNLSEEERLFYVAITRAEDRLTITSNREDGGPTFFLPPPSTPPKATVSAEADELELL